MAALDKNYLTIGKLVKKLRKIYIDISSSKLRFLESQGLIHPKRGDNKYRIYDKNDVEKINYILKMQNEFYLPLNIIKEKLKSGEYKDFSIKDSGRKDLQLEFGEDFVPDFKNKTFTMEELKKRFKLSRDFIDELLKSGILDWKEENGKYILTEEDIGIVQSVSELAKFGIHVKNLSIFENFATRHSSFIQQIILPLVMSSNKESYKKAQKIIEKLEKIFCDFHRLLLVKENRKFLEKHR